MGLTTRAFPVAVLPEPGFKTTLYKLDGLCVPYKIGELRRAVA